MSNRVYCSHCQYPSSTCVCDALKTVDTDINISILQDPSETRHAKNTARLAALITPKVEIYVGECPKSFAEVIRRVSELDRSLLIYPSASAQEISYYAASMVQYEHLILIDGTWRKAKKLWLNNPWLHALDTALLNLDEKSQYSIRKSLLTNSLSTLEALAYSLNSLDGTPLAPFLEVLSAMQSHWQKNQPHKTGLD